MGTPNNKLAKKAGIINKLRHYLDFVYAQTVILYPY